MGQAELNRLVTSGGHSWPAELTQPTLVGLVAVLPPGESQEGGWESAWIDLGGEG